jgi:hypothetical protein
MKLRKTYLSTLLIIGLIIGAFVVSSISANKLLILPDDELDQEQPFSDFYAGVPLECCRFAQSFTPTLNILTRVQLEMSGAATVSIRDNLNGSDLTSGYGEKSSSYPFDWVEFDFTDISVVPGQLYYIIWNPNSTSYVWGNKDYNKYDNGEAFYYNCESWEPFRGDFTFKTYGYNEDLPAISDLDCEGSISWSTIEPGSLVTSSFSVRNVGDSDSLLTWEIDSFPDWGDWTFTPSNGYGLMPSDGLVTVEVMMVAPNIEESTFSGEILVKNMDDSSDYELISVSLSTPKNEGIINLLPITLVNYPRLFLLFRIIFNL